MCQCRKWIMWTAAFSICCLLSACSPQQAPEELLQFPGASWGATPQEVTDALQIPEGAAESGERTDGGQRAYYLALQDWSCFGTQANYVILRFYEQEPGSLGLESVEVYYPDDTDMSAVRDALIQTYGSDAASYTMLHGGLMVDPDATVPENAYSLETVTPERDAENGSWVAGTPAAYFSQESKDAVERLLCDRDTNPLTEAGFSQFWESAPLVTLRCTDHAYDQFQELPGAFSRKALFFSATLMNWISAHDGVAG